jgi:hypothetical protein
MHHEFLLGLAIAQHRAAIERAEHHRLIRLMHPRRPRADVRPLDEGWAWVWDAA